MRLATIVNVIASGVLAAGVSAFMVLLYRTGGIVERFHVGGSLVLRICLAGTAAGALGNCLTLSTPPDTEILMNCGLAGIFVWASIFHAKLIKHGPPSQRLTGTDESDTRQAAGTEGSNK